MRIALIGVGLIGREHLKRFLAEPRVDHVVVVDGRVTDVEALRTEFRDTRISLADGIPDLIGQVDGAIIATPTAAHSEAAVQLLDAGIPVLVEKPIADNESDALRIVDASQRTSTPALIGHHRRYSAALGQARDTIDSGVLGDLVAITGSALFAKPSNYFEEAPWRTVAGGGPLLINFIHDADALRMLAGDVEQVRAVASNSARGFVVEDTVVISLEFASGVLGSFTLSDAAASHRSWEQTSGENPGYDRDPEADAYHLAGRTGSLSIPSMRLSRADGEASWWKKSEKTRITIDDIDPLTAQARHFLDVVAGLDTPRVTATDGLQALRIVLAAAESAQLGGDAVAVTNAATSPS